MPEKLPLPRVPGVPLKRLVWQLTPTSLFTKPSPQFQKRHILDDQKRHGQVITSLQLHIIAEYFVTF
jgi:hypothetical protein